ncbi:MAG TPA: DUF4340 domain-containing protein [Pseudomonadales bacterium]
MKTQTWLGGLLALQLLLAAGLALNGLHARTADNAAPLFDFETADVDRIVIEDNAAKATTLARNDEGWQVASLSGLPANTAKTDGMLDTLAGLRTTMPVVSTAAGRERFEVTEENFQRRLRLYDGDELLGEYFFGTSPGFRRTHGRRADDDEVYALAFNNFDLPGDGNDWLDKTLLSAGEARKVKGPDYELSSDGTSWKLAAADAGEVAPQVDAGKVEELVNALESMRVLRAEDGLPEGERVVVDVTTSDGDLRYEFATDGAKYYVKRSDHARAFTISQTDYERIAGKTRQMLINSAAAEDVGDDAAA